MKKIKIVLILILTISKVVLCQEKIDVEEVYSPGFSILKSSFVSERDGFLLLNNGQVKKTTDSGRTWVNSGSIENELIIDYGIYQIYDRVNDFKFINESIGFIITRFSIFKTINGGQTWVLKANTNDDIRLDLRGIDFKNNTMVVSIKGCNIGETGSQNCVLRYYLKSTNLGENWSLISTNDYPSDYLKIKMKNENEWYASTYVYQSQIGIDFSKYIRKTTDGGSTWTNYYKDRTFLNQIVDFAFRGDSMYVGGTDQSYIDRGGGITNQITMTFGDYSHSSKIEITDISFITTDILFAKANTSNFPNFVSGGVAQSIVISKDKGKTWRLVDDLEFNGFVKQNYKYLEVIGKRAWLISDDNKVYTFKYVNDVIPYCNEPYAYFNRPSTNLVVGETLNLDLNLIGIFPIKFRMNNQFFIAHSSPFRIEFQPQRDTTFVVDYVKSICGTVYNPGQISSVSVSQLCVLPKVSTSYSSTINVGQTAQIYVSVEGTVPITCKIGGVIYTLNGSTWLNVSPNLTTIYAVTEISNRCGAGVTEGSAIVTVNCSPLTKAVITGDNIAYSGDSINLNVQFTGIPPFSFNLYVADLLGHRLYKEYTNIIEQSYDFKVRPYDPYGNNFDLGNYRDACGNGRVEGYVFTTLTNCVKQEPTLSTATPVIYAGEGGAIIDINFQEDLPKPFVISIENTSYYSYGNPYQYWVNPTSTKKYTLNAYYDGCLNKYIYVNKEITITVLPSNCTKANAILTGSQIITEGDSAILSVNLTGTPPYNIIVHDGFYENRFGYENIQSSPFNFKVAPNSTTTYHISSVTNGCQFGTVSGTATVTVDIPNCIAMNAKISGTQSIKAGESATLNLEATGTMPYNIVLNGTSITNITNRYHSLTVNPSSTTIYTISQISNRCGIGTFDGNAKISVLPSQYCPPSLTIENGPQTGGIFGVSKFIESRATSNINRNYLAGESILLLPGFETKENIFIAKIESCTSPPTIPTDGLLLYCPFNGNANDVSGNSNNGIIQGNPNFILRGSQQALNFSPNSGQFVSVPNNSSLQNLTSMTLSAWIKPSSFDLNCYTEREQLIGKGKDVSDNAFGLSIQRNITPSSCGEASSFDSYKLNFELGSSTISSPIYSIDNIWKHVLCTYDGITQKIYVDGILMQQATVGAINTTNSIPLYFNYSTWDGGYSNTNGRYGGGLDDIRIYNRALSDLEVTTIYNSEK
jgi:photosystem II stability/assembly factor-like uncharacterized protein